MTQVLCIGEPIDGVDVSMRDTDVPMILTPTCLRGKAFHTLKFDRHTAIVLELL